MDESRHRRWVAHHLKGKIKEFTYHLESIIGACDESLRLFASDSERSENFNPTVIYGFSSFVNVALTLREQASTILEKKIEWADINKPSYCDFINKCRNAITHDGHPIFDCWNKGRWYVDSPITRIDGHKQVLTIPAPDVDARTFCLGFAYDYSGYLSNALAPALNNPAYMGAYYSFDEYEDKINSKHIPDFARAGFEENKEILSLALAVAKTTQDPIAEARQGLDQLAEYCKKKMEQENLVII